jgi:hypothetical protein
MAGLVLSGCAGVHERVRAERDYCESAQGWAHEMERQGVDLNDPLYLYYKFGVCNAYETKKNSVK